MLTPEQIKAREGLLTASRVACLMTADKEKIHNLWLELIGDPSFVQDDLSDIWAVQLGSFTEPLNIQWYARRKGLVVARQGEVVVHSCGWAAATLDGWDPVRQCPIECKHVGGFEKLDKIIERYFPQVHWQMLVTGTKECALSVIMGAQEPIVEYIKLNDIYAAELWQRAEAFMECVRSLTPPVILDAVAAPIVARKEYCMDGNNAWSAAAADYLETKKPADLHNVAKDLLKELIPRDGQRVYGHGVVATRDRANRISIKEGK